LNESSKQWASRAALATACLTAVVGADARAHDTLCQPGEAVVFACHVGRKSVSLCRPSALPHEMTYRFGTPARVELAHPPAGKQLRAPFTLSTAPLFGGGVTTVGFRRGEYEYQVYSKVSRSDDDDRAPLFEDGVIVSRRGKQVAKMVCDDGGEGFREGLDWLPLAAPR
jgi:hypothetical protein